MLICEKWSLNFSYKDSYWDLSEECCSIIIYVYCINQSKQLRNLFYTIEKLVWKSSPLPYLPVSYLSMCAEHIQRGPEAHMGTLQAP